MMTDFTFFWKIIKSCNWKHQGDDTKVIQPLIEKLSKLEDADIFLFNDMMTELLYQLDSKELFAEFTNFLGYENEEHFLYSRCAALINGEDFYYRLLNNEEFIWDMEFESLLDVLEATWELKHKNNNYIHNTTLSYETRSNKAKWDENYLPFSYKGRRTFVKGVDCWIVDYVDNSFYTIWDTKYGYVQYKVIEFESIDECRKTIDKRIANKIKTGYVEANDYSNYICIAGKKTAHTKQLYHPNFIKYFTSGIYYASNTQFAPFDKSVGIDVLEYAQIPYHGGEETDFLKHAEKLVKEVWKYRTYYNPLEWSNQNPIVEEVYISFVATYCTAFAQIKITGKVSKEVKIKALSALKILYDSFDKKLYNSLAGYHLWANHNEKTKLAKLFVDLSLFIAEDETIDS